MLGGKADVVLSDMAANATGHRKTDHLRIMALAEAAAQFAREVLAKGGTLRLQGAARRHRSHVARRTQARFRDRQTRQAAGEPQRFGGALSAGARLSRRSGVVDPPIRRLRRLAARKLRAGVGREAIEDQRRGRRQRADRPETPAENPRRSSRFHGCSRSVISTTSAPTATPVESDNCCAAAMSAVARLISGGSISA